MFQVWIGPAFGRTNKIIYAYTQKQAEKAARDRVLEAKKEGRSMAASVFDRNAGVVISAFATSDLAEEAKRFPNVKIL